MRDLVFQQQCGKRSLVFQNVAPCQIVNSYWCFRGWMH